MIERGVPEEWVRQTVSAPESVHPTRRGREVRQRRFSFPEGGGEHLLRAVVEAAGSDLVLVTVYHTSKTRKYGGIT